MNTISKNVVENKFNEEEYPIYMKTYLFIKGFAHGCELQQTLKALPLARVLHDGQHRNGGAPYIIHPLKVCSTLISLGIKDDEIPVFVSNEFRKRVRENNLLGFSFGI